MLMFQWLNILRYSRRVHIASICSTRMQSTNKSSAQNFLQNCYSKCFCFIAATAAATAFAASSEKKKNKTMLISRVLWKKLKNISPH